MMKHEALDLLATGLGQYQTTTSTSSGGGERNPPSPFGVDTKNVFTHIFNIAIQKMILNRPKH